jgi:hypothetical protein
MAAARRIPLRRAAVLGLVMLGVCAAQAGADGTAETITTEPDGLTSRPVLWDGGVAWSNYQGIYAATPGSAPRQLAKITIYDGYLTGYMLDSGAGTPNSTGALAYGWQQDNNQTPPMGPGDTKVPSPPIPYETGDQGAGVIAADGQVTALPNCPFADPFSVGGQNADADEHFAVSLSGDTVGYGCPYTGSPGFLGLSSVAMPATTAQRLTGFGSSFQISGDFVVSDAVPGLKPGEVDIEDLAGNTVSEFLTTPASAGIEQLALQSDGTLVVVGAGTASCPSPPKIKALGEVGIPAVPTAWFAPGDPTPHQLGCFYSSAPRPVGGQWIGLTPDPAGGADLVAVELASGTTRTLETFPNPEMFAGADTDGQSLAWSQATCAGTEVELTPDLATMTPGAPPPTRCPVTFLVHGPLYPTANGTVHVTVSCALGCRDALGISKPRRLENLYATSFELPPGSASVRASIRLGPKQLRYLRAHGPLKITLSAREIGPGSATTTSRAHVTLAR